MAHILAALESADHLRQFGQFANQYGHQVVGAKDLRRTKDVLHTRQFDAVVASVDFEHGEILALLRSVRSQPADKRLLFVLFAELKEEPGSQRAQHLRLAVRALGADKLVTFPKFHAAELWWQVAVCLPDRQT